MTIQQIIAEGNGCSRQQSRIAQSIVDKTVLSIMRREGLEPERDCPLRLDRNMYWENERHKQSEIANNWHCLYCGKSFYNEKFLDKHFENRHADTIFQGPQSVCLADHCDYLRCDVITEVKKSSYWDEALCKHRELEALNKKCQAIMKSCIPSHITGADKYILLEKLKSSVCSYLTCEGYWDNPHSETPPHKMAAYAFLTVILVVGLMLYYMLAYSHLFSDNSHLADSDGLIRKKVRNQNSRGYHSFQPAQGQTMRNRPSVMSER